MGKSTEFNLRTVPRLFDVMDEKVTRGDSLVVSILKHSNLRKRLCNNCGASCCRAMYSGWI